MRQVDILVNIYATNNDDPEFFSNLFFNLSSLHGQYIISGDPSKDRSSHIDKM